MKTRRICYACDLKDNPELIQQYIEYHQEVWPEIKASIRDAGIMDMEIFQVFNRLFMIMEVNETFDPDIKSKMDTENPKVQEWENLMWKFQQSLPNAEKGEKWVRMQKIFKL